MTNPIFIRADMDSPVDHGALQGLSDNDHPQYALEVDFATLQAAWNAFLANPNPLTQYILATVIGAPNGLAQLGSDGILKLAQRPPASATFVTATTTTMLGSDTSAAVAGDFAAVTAGSQTYRYLGDVHGSAHANAANWVLFGASSPVTSVDGLQGIISLIANGGVTHDATLATKRTLDGTPGSGAPYSHDALHDGRFVRLGYGGADGLMPITHSYGSYDEDPTGNDVPYPPAAGSTGMANYARSWPEILRRLHGLPSHVRQFTIAGLAGNTTASSQALFALKDFGALRAAHFTPLISVTGSGGGRQLVVSKCNVFGSNAFSLTLSAGNNLTAGVRVVMPRTFTPAADWLVKDQLEVFVSIPGASVPDAPGLLELEILTDEFFPMGMVGAKLTSSNPFRGGWAEVDVLMSFRAIRDGVWQSVVTLDSAGKIDKSLVRAGSPLWLHGLNDAIALNDQTAVKHALRHGLAATRWMARYTCHTSVPSITTGDGSNGGGWTTDSGVNPTMTYAGFRRYYTAPTTGSIDYTTGLRTLSGTKPYIEITIPADYDGEVVDLLLLSEPARSESISVQSGSRTLAAPIPNYTGDDLGRFITSQHLTLGTTITGPSSVSTTASATATENAVIGVGGGTGTVTIDGVTPMSLGVTLNDVSTDQITTDRVTGLVSVDPAQTLGAGGENCFAIPICTRIKGMSPGIHHVRWTLDTVAIGPSRVYSNGWAREAPDAPQEVANIPVPPAQTAIAARIATYNATIATLLAEFTDAYLVDLYALMSPAGVPTPNLFIADDYHPSFQGHQVIAAAFELVRQSLTTRQLVAS